MFKLPTQDGVQIQTGTTIGPKAKKPLNLEIPILITGMSYGSALSLKAKVALARGASMAGTATNSGEAPLVDEERREAKFFIGQYNRGGFMNTHDQLSQLDAIEVQLGQGAQAAAPMKMGAHQIGEELRKAKKLEPGEDAVIHSRLPGVNQPEDIIALIKGLKAKYDVPVGIKICATHYMEQELEMAIQAGVDYFVVDGAEAGTHGGPTTLQDDVGLPTLFALNRAINYLEIRGVKQDISIIAAGGLTTPGHFLKAMALGADAVYIGSIALMAMLQTQMAKALPTEPAPQIPLYLGKFKEDLDVEEGAEHLAKFLKSCVEEMKLVAYALGKTDLAQLKRSDLVTVNRELAEILGIDYAGYPSNHPNNTKKRMEWIPNEAEIQQETNQIH
jgi:glutamate synthase domain-containing protein 2